MKKLRDVSPIWHAVIWIVAYVLLVNVGDWVSELIGEPNAGAASLLVVLSIVLLIYVTRNGWSRYYGLRPLRRDQFAGTMLYLPLVVIAVMQYAKGFRDDLDLMAVLLIVILMICVGFIEELVFRGLLFRGILNKSNLTRAVVISGVTFAVGHIVNLARGYTGVEQIVQIGMAAVLGVVLALLFAITGTILPLIAFHALLNISGNLTRTSVESEWLVLAATVVIGAGYAVYLVMVLRKRGLHPDFRESTSPAQTAGSR